MKKRFKKGDNLVLTSGYGYAAEDGATASCGGYEVVTAHTTYIVIFWDRSDPRHKGQSDGCYFQADFKKAAPISWRNRLSQSNASPLKQEGK